MPGAIRNRDIRAKHDVYVLHRIVHLLHDPRAITIGLYIFNRRNESRSTDLCRTPALLRASFNFAQAVIPRNVVKRRSGLGIPDVGGTLATTQMTASGSAVDAPIEFDFDSGPPIDGPGISMPEDDG